MITTLVLLVLAAPVTSSTTARPLVGLELELEQRVEDCLATADHLEADEKKQRDRADLLERKFAELRAQALLTVVAPPEPVESPVASLVRGTMLVIGAGLGAGVGAGGCALAHCEPLPAVGVAAGSGLLGGALTALVLLAGGG